MRPELRRHHYAAPANPHPLPNLPLERGGTQRFPSSSGGGEALNHVRFRTSHAPHVVHGVGVGFIRCLFNYGLLSNFDIRLALIHLRFITSCEL